MAKDRDIEWGDDLSELAVDISDAAVRKIMDLGEEVLRRHILSDIYGVDRRGEHSWVHRKKYERRNNLPNTVYSYREGDVVWITASGEPDTPVRKNATFVSAEPGAFLALLESGNLGFLTRRSPKYMPLFPRPAIRNAQAEVDSEAFQQRIKQIIEKS